jgi:hypothetical protein
MQSTAIIQELLAIINKESLLCKVYVVLKYWSVFRSVFSIKEVLIVRVAVLPKKKSVSFSRFTVKKHFASTQLCKRCIHSKVC